MKSRRKVVQGSVALLKESKQLGCVSQDTEPPKKSILRKSGNFGIKLHRQVLQGHVAHIWDLAKKCRQAQNNG